MTSAGRRCAVILSPVFFLLLPASSLCSAFCSRWLSCCVPVISDSSFFLSLLGGKAKETKGQREGGGWMHCCINSGLLSGAVGDHHYRNITHLPVVRRYSFFLLAL